MKKNELVKLLDEILKPIGFKKKGSFWYREEDNISKMVNLQKSQYGNLFYINYGYIINSLPLGKSNVHVFKGFGSPNVKDQNLIKELLDLENVIEPEYRIRELKKYINELLIATIEKIKTEEDLLISLKKQPHLNDISLVVKKYFNLI